MSYKESHLFILSKQISFALGLLGMISQPISKAFSSTSDTNYELVDIDWEDDTEKEEAEDKLEEDEKVRPYTTILLVSDTDRSKCSIHFYNLQLDASYSIEILIPPPEFV